MKDRGAHELEGTVSYRDRRRDVERLYGPPMADIHRPALLAGVEIVKLRSWNLSEFELRFSHFSDFRCSMTGVAKSSRLGTPVTMMIGPASGGSNFSLNIPSSLPISSSARFAADASRSVTSNSTVLPEIIVAIF